MISDIKPSRNQSKSRARKKPAKIVKYRTSIETVKPSMQSIRSPKRTKSRRARPSVTPIKKTRPEPAVSKERVIKNNEVTTEARGVEANRPANEEKLFSTYDRENSSLEKLRRSFMWFAVAAIAILTFFGYVLYVRTVNVKLSGISDESYKTAKTEVVIAKATKVLQNYSYLDRISPFFDEEQLKLDLTEADVFDEATDKLSLDYLTGTVKLELADEFSQSLVYKSSDGKYLALDDNGLTIVVIDQTEVGVRTVVDDQSQININPGDQAIPAVDMRYMLTFTSIVDDSNYFGGVSRFVIGDDAREARVVFSEPDRPEVRLRTNSTPSVDIDRLQDFLISKPEYEGAGDSVIDLRLPGKVIVN